MSEIFDIALRASLAYFLLLLLTRIMGRKQITQLTFFDFVSGITLGSVAASTLVNPMLPISIGIVAVVVWTAWVLATDKLVLNSLPARKLVEAEPLMVIHRGKILEENLASRQYNVNDLLKQLRENSIFDPGQVEVAIIETDGEISILKKSQFQPMTVGDVGTIGQLAPTSNLIGKELVIDGEIIKTNLNAAGITKEELINYLHSSGYKQISDVELVIMNPNGGLYIDSKKDKDLAQ